MKDLVGIITPWFCVDGKFTIDGNRITVRLRNTDCTILRPGDLLKVEGFERWRFQDGFVEFIRKDYVGENVTSCAFRRIKL
jgi:hypothetical protein